MQSSVRKVFDDGKLWVILKTYHSKKVVTSEHFVEAISTSGNTFGVDKSTVITRKNEQWECIGGVCKGTIFDVTFEARMTLKEYEALKKRTENSMSDSDD